MTDDLVKRLRELDTWVETAHTPVEAADRIEALEREKREAALDAIAAMGQAQEAYEAQLKAEAKVEALERERDKARKYRDAYAECDRIGTQAVRDLEARLDKAVVALRVLIDHAHNCEKELTEELHHADFCGESLPLTKARAVLAEIEGKKNE